jgi:hypothetical protein
MKGTVIAMPGLGMSGKVYIEKLVWSEFKDVKSRTFVVLIWRDCWNHYLCIHVVGLWILEMEIVMQPEHSFLITLFFLSFFLVASYNQSSDQVQYLLIFYNYNEILVINQLTN